MNSNKWIKPTIYGLSIFTGITGSIASGITGGLILPLIIGVGAGGAVGWWINQIVKTRS